MGDVNGNGEMRRTLVLVLCLAGLLSVMSGDDSSNPPHVLVTGGLGFIGSHVVEKLVASGAKVTILDDASNGRNENSAVTIVLGDIASDKTYQKLDALNINYVIHLAAAISVVESLTDPDKYQRVNVRGSRLLFDWAARNSVKRVVTASSAAVYGDSAPIPINESSPYGGLSPYAESKWAMELEQHRAWTSHALQSVALRFFNVFGPRQDPHSPYSGVISKFMHGASLHLPLTIFGDGSQSRDFIYVEDIANAILHALFSSNLPPATTEPDSEAATQSGVRVFNVCTGAETSVNELARLVLAAYGIDSTSEAGMIKHAAPRDGEILRSVCDPTALNSRLGFKAQFDVAQGLHRTREWLAQVANDGKVNSNNNNDNNNTKNTLNHEEL